MNYKAAYTYLPVIALIVTSKQEQPPQDYPVQFTCTIQATPLNLIFFQSRHPFRTARKSCRKMKSQLLRIRKYQQVKDCVTQHTKSLNPSGIWLADGREGNRARVIVNYNQSLPKSKHENYSYICCGPALARPIGINCSVSGLNFQDARILKQPGDLQVPSKMSSELMVAQVQQSCSALGSYECVVQLSNRTMTRQVEDYKADNCSPQLCHREQKVKDISLTYRQKSFSFCVVAHPGISDYLIVNSSSIHKNETKNLRWKCERHTLYMSYNITILVQDLQQVSCGELSIGVCTTQGDDYRLNITRILSTLASKDALGADQKTEALHPPESFPHYQDKVGTSLPPVEALTQDYLSLAVPVAVATTLIVLSCCCLVCVLCVALLCRRKAQMLRFFADTNVRHLATQTSDSDTRTRDISTTRRTLSKHSREPGYSEDEEELYSTATTVNDYANLSSLVQASSDLYLKNASKAVECARKSKSLPPVKYQSLGRDSVSETRCTPDQNRSGRFISDGLLYTTLAHKSSPEKPLKSKSDEQVQYLKLNFNHNNAVYKKSGKLSTRRQHKL